MLISALTQCEGCRFKASPLRPESRQVRRVGAYDSVIARNVVLIDRTGSVCREMSALRTKDATACNKASYNIPRVLYIRDLTRRTRVAVKRIHI
jgi:hypothetical protein